MSNRENYPVTPASEWPSHAVPDYGEKRVVVLEAHDGFELGGSMKMRRADVDADGEIAVIRSNMNARGYVDASKVAYADEDGELYDLQVDRALSGKYPQHVVRDQTLPMSGRPKWRPIMSKETASLHASDPYPVGTQFKTRGKAPKLCTVEDQLYTYNSEGELVGFKYVASNVTLGQKVYDYDVSPATVVRGLV